MSSKKGGRVSGIPESVKKVIENIKEITGNNHEDDEIYATLKDCAMDPNETAQTLLNQDTFQQVKSKRDKRKESSNIKESVESRGKPVQGRGSKGGRGIYSSRYIGNDNSVKNNSVGKVNNGNQASEKISSVPQELKKNGPSAATSSALLISNGPSATVAKVTKADISKSGGPAPPEHLAIVKENPWKNSGMGKAHKQLGSSMSNRSAADSQVTSPGAQFSSSDPVLVPSNDSRIPGAAGTIKRELGGQRNPAEKIPLAPSEGKVISDSKVGNSSKEGNAVQSKSTGVGKSLQSDTAPRPSSAHGSSSLVRPLSNHSSRSQQVVGPPKVGPTKEWKLKSSNQSLAQGSSVIGQSEVSSENEVNSQSRPVTADPESVEASTKLQRKLEELHIFDNPQVIMPNHLLIPGTEKVSFCFGSFDAIGLNTSFKTAPDSNPAPTTETCQSVEETTEQITSLESVPVASEEGGYHDHSESPEDVRESSSPAEHDVPSAGTQQYGESKPEGDFPQQRSYQYPVMHSSSYGFGLMPTMMGSQPPPFEGSESQAREASHGQGFVVPQPFDPASYYAQFYRSPTDGDGRISPFHAAGVASKYNGSVPVLSPQTSQSVPEGGNSLAVSTAGPNAFVTQPAAGVMPSSIAVTQQPVPVFRQPIGIPFPHYPPNYMPYGPYFSPFFVPTFNQSLSNSVYPQQPQAGNLYSAPPGPSPKFSLPQYKPGSGSENSNSVGVASSYQPYGPSASTTGNSTTNEDLTVQQFKENMYITGQQQTEGQPMWLTPPGRDLSSVQASSFYNVPSQGQVAFPQPQPGHGPFTGIYHTQQGVSSTTGHLLLQQSQSMASPVDIAGPVYQQPQHAQVTWANNNY